MVFEFEERAHVVAVGVLPVLASIHGSDPGDRDVVLGESLEHGSV